MPTMNRREVTSREAAENILKTILTLHLRCGHAYVSEIAEALEMNLTTTYTVVAQMVREGLLQPLDGGRGRRAQKQSMTFTPRGEELARNIFERHQAIQKWLNRLGIPLEEADAEACYMEHGVTERTMQILREHVRMATEFTDGEPRPAAETVLEMTGQASEEDEIISEHLLRLLDELGGTEGIARKKALLDRARSEEELEEVLALVEDCGDVETLRAQAQRGRELTALLDELGGEAQVREVMTLVKRLGGLPSLHRLVPITERCGGAGPFLDLVNEEYQLWHDLFATEAD